ncbi:MAG: carboxyl transferase [Proteobacteria bacterium]|nr:carboxyl transferase [Pseudomonadota bacterium]
MPFEKELAELEERRRHALEMGGKEKVARQHERGRLTARERIARLLDPDTFMEMGMFNHSDMPGMEDKTPADSKIGGYGEIDGRPVAILANDFTVFSATSSRVAGFKEGQIRHDAERKGFPVVYLGEAGGARMPDIMGARGLASFGGKSVDGFAQSCSRERVSPMVMAVMGNCYGMPTWMACLADFVVQVKGAAMAVSGPRVLELALSQKISDEELGGWKVHAEITGMVDAVAEDEEDCFRIIRRYLSYMPSHRDELPPDAEVPPGSGDKMDKILDLLPEKRNRAYDMNRLLRCIVDEDSLFPLKPLFGRNTITALARVQGKVVGLVANQPIHGGGAMDTDGLDKTISFFCLCDSFNIPVVFFHDIPGFLVGREAERKRVAARVINHMQAMSLLTVPRISVIVRKTYGMAYWNMGGTGCGTDFLVAWPTAEMSFVDPEIAVNVVYGGKNIDRGPDDEEYQALVRKMVEDASPFGAAGVHLIHDVIDPRETRAYIARALDICRRSKTRGISQHKLAAWPTKF